MPATNHPIRFILILLIFSIAAAGCGVSAEMLALNRTAVQDLKVETHPWYHKKHHVDKEISGFRNIWGPQEKPWFFRVMAYFIFRSSVVPRSKPTPFRAMTGEDLRKPFTKYRVHWLGHATTLIRMKGHNVLTDPVYSYRVSPVSFAGPHRLVKVPLPLEKLPPIHTVIISHNHYDHMDEATIRALHKKHKPLFLVHRKSRDLLLSWGVTRVMELDWWQYVDHRGLRFHSTPTKHFSSRGAFDRDEVLWGSWYIEDKANDTRIYFAGDTAYAAFFKEIRERLGAPDLAILPIGAYKPGWIMKHVHVTPDEAMQAFVDLGAREFFGIHWGTFELADELLHQPPLDTRAAARKRGIDEARIGLPPVGGDLGR